MTDEKTDSQNEISPIIHKPKRIRRKFDHKLTKEELNEIKKEKWREWYHTKGGKEKEKERGKLNQRKKAEKYKFYKQQFENQQKSDDLKNSDE